jgi:hypothetical protein
MRSPDPHAMSRSFAFDLEPGQKLGTSYRVEEFLGAGWEGEVYRVVEVPTGISRAAKLFYPRRNPFNRTVKRACSIVCVPARWSSTTITRSDSSGTETR